MCIDGCSLIKNHTHKGPRAVSKRKKIPTSGELIYCGARVTNTIDRPTVKTIRKVNNKSKSMITNEVTKGSANTAVNSLPKINEGTKLISL